LTFTNAPNGQVLAESLANGNVYYPQTDNNGSLVAELAKVMGAASNQCSYDAQGNATCSNATVPNLYGPMGALCTSDVQSGSLLCNLGGGFVETSSPISPADPYGPCVETGPGTMRPQCETGGGLGGRLPQMEKLSDYEIELLKRYLGYSIEEFKKEWNCPKPSRCDLYKDGDQWSG
jgi:hypothetical protein